MAAGIHQNNVYGIFIFFIVVSCYHMLINGLVGGSRISFVAKNVTVEPVERKERVTLESEDGIIDCVDIYQQPAFSNPLLKNHTIQMKPSSNPSGVKSGNLNIELFQDWHKNGWCPEGTIPISRTKLHDLQRSIPYVPNNTKLDNSLAVLDSTHEYAQVSVVGGNYYGAHAYVNVWNPATYDGEISFSQIWVLSGHETGLNSIEAGWLVRSEEKQTLFFIYWTRDGYQDTGCYNLECPGFVQTNHKFALGASIKPISTYNGQQYELDLTIHKDKQSGNWWLKVQNQELGYWPGSIFTSLAESSTSINWGGEIVNSGVEGRHTSTQMGNGHLPGEGFGRASYFRQLGYVDDFGVMKDPAQLIPYVTKPPCYDLRVANDKGNVYGVHFYYGGPGYSVACP